MLKPHPRLATWLEIGGALFAAGEGLVDEVRRKAKPRRWQSYHTVRPGAATPLWNILADQVRAELAPHGAKTRLARYLGIPRQRLQDFLSSKNRMPDAELTLRILHWLAEKRGGRDISL
ncbi:MAG: hypothetical protein KF715_10335 [Candidatus Didemnitutus sp.]|nr:hypothetical protein [Candidatus Didemnitutus sp.]